MAEVRLLGCGRLSEGDWAELVTGAEPNGGLLRHVRSCALCRAELAAFDRLTSQVRHVLAEADATLHGAVRDAFVEGVMAHVRRQPPTPAPPPELARLAGIGTARRRARWPAWAAAAATVIVAILAAGTPWSTDVSGPAGPRSTGQAWPGGTILAVADVATVHAAGLTTTGVVQAAAGEAAMGAPIVGGPGVVGWAGDAPAAVGAELSMVSMAEGDGAVPLAATKREEGAPIRVPSGFVSAAGGTPAESEGGISIP